MIHSEEFLAIVNDAMKLVREVSVEQAIERMHAGAVLIDVREDNEFNAAHAEGARHMGRGIIERDIVQTFPNKDTELVLYCGGGYRSALATGNLQKMGYTNVWSMAGGWHAWEEAKAPIEIPIPFSNKTMEDPEFDPRVRTREIAAEFAERGDVLGWFEALYKESAGNTDLIPWADLEPNKYFRQWAESTGLKGNGRKALVVGCGLGDDAKYLDDLGFKVTAFDISPTAIEWAKRLYGDADIAFEACDLFQPPREWFGGFDFVLEVYTIQPLPLEMRPKVVDAIAGFVGKNGRLVVVTRGREDDEEPDILPWPMSRRDLSQFEKSGLTQTDFVVMPGDEDEPDRFVVEYLRVL